MAAEGVCKALVHDFGRGDGYQVSEPVWDYSSYAGTSASEGVKITATQRTSLSTTRRIYTASEWAFYTQETYDSMDEASESVREFHANAHGHAHAEKMECRILQTFNSFTTHTIAATASTGLTWGHISAARTKLEMSQTPAPKPYYLVVTPNVWHYFVKNTAQNSSYGPVGTVADQLMQKYHIGSLVGGVEVFWTPYDLSASVLVTTNATTRCAMFTKAAIGLFIPRQYRFEAQKEVRERGYDLVSTLKSGARVRTLAWGVRIKATGTTPSS